MQNVDLKNETPTCGNTVLADSRSINFHEWLYKCCEIKAGKLKEAHDIFPYVDLTDAKLAFIDGMTELEYSKHISNF